MSTDILHVRERALEYEFFHKVDEELWQRLREKLEFENRRHALADATGISEEAVLDELVASGINGETILALSLFPLVWIAWSDGHIEQDERTAVLAAAEGAGHARDSASFQLIEFWLDHRPKNSLQAAWTDYVHCLAKTMSPTAYRVFADDVLRRSHGLADTVCFRYGCHGAEFAQDAVLEQLEKTFRHAMADRENRSPDGNSGGTQEVR